MGMYLFPLIVAASSSPLSCDDWNRLADDSDNILGKICQVAQSHLDKDEFLTMWSPGFKGDPAHSVFTSREQALAVGAREACGTEALKSVITARELTDDGSIYILAKEVAIHGTSALLTGYREFDKHSRYRLDDPYGCAKGFRNRAHIVKRRPPNCARQVPCI
jgi:hypothetical protein